MDLKRNRLTVVVTLLISLTRTVHIHTERGILSEEVETTAGDGSITRRIPIVLG